MTEIKYKDTVISVEAGQTATLHTTDKKLTGDIVISVPKAESGGSPSDSRDYYVLCYNARAAGNGTLYPWYVLYSENPTKASSGTHNSMGDDGRRWFKLNKGEKIAFVASGDGFEYIKCESLGINITKQNTYTPWIELTEDLFDLEIYSYIEQTGGGSN